MAPVKDYTPEQMGLAIDAVRKGLKVAEAAKNFGVPRITLYNKITGKSPIVCTMGPSTILSKEDENILEIWIKDMAKRHIPITKEELLDSVQRLITEKNLNTPFTDNRPGKKWYASFLKRHPDISERTAQNLTTARDNVSEEQLKSWFIEVENYLKDKNLIHVLEKPERIFNTDESAFFLNPKPGRVLAKKGDKHIYSSSGDEKDNLTVLVTGNADGQLAPTMVVFNYERIPSTISSSFPDEWVIGRSESGWMRGSTFFEYITNNFNKWLIEQKIEKPVLFFLDGHKSHLTLHLSNFCVANGIEIISLYPNSTHLLQQMDLAVFRPLKNSWRKAVQSWKMQNLGKNLKKENFAPVLKTALTKLTGDSIKHGFRAAGLYPYGPDYVDMSKIKTQKRQTSNHISGNEFLNCLERKIVSTLSQKKLNLFRECYYKRRSELENSLPEEDVSLYVVWANSLSQDGSNECDTSTPHTSRQGQNVSSVDQNHSLPTEFDNEISRTILADENSKKINNIASQIPPGSNECDTLAPDTSSQAQNVVGVDQNLSLPTELNNCAIVADEISNIIDHLAIQLPLDNLNESCPKIALNQTEKVKNLLQEVSNSDLVQGLSNLGSSEYSQSLCDFELAAVEPNIANAPATSQRDFKYPSCSINDKTPKKVLETRSSISDTRPRFINLDNNISSNVANVPGPSHKNEIAPPPVNKQEHPFIPSPFKLACFWPGEEESTKGKKRKMKEKLPFAATSPAWREYHKKKEEDKRIQLEEKEKRAKERQEKRILKEKLKGQNKKKTTIKKKRIVTKKRLQAKSASSETEEEVDYAESGNSYEIENDEESDEESYCESENMPLSKLSAASSTKKQLIGSYVIVIYEGEYFPGIIENVNKDRYEISTMTFSTGNTYKWPEKKDKLWYNKHSVVENISPPILVNKRGFYSVKEMKKYSIFTS